MYATVKKHCPPEESGSWSTFNNATQCLRQLLHEMRLQFECLDIKNYTKSLKSDNELEPLKDLEIAYMHTGQLVILVAQFSTAQLQITSIICQFTCCSDGIGIVLRQWY